MALVTDAADVAEIATCWLRRLNGDSFSILSIVHIQTHRPRRNSSLAHTALTVGSDEMIIGTGYAIAGERPARNRPRER